MLSAQSYIYGQILTILVIASLASSDDGIINPSIFIPCYYTRCYKEIGCIEPFISGLIILVPPFSVCAERYDIVKQTFHIGFPDNPENFLHSSSLEDIRPGKSLAFFTHGCFGSYADKNALVPGFALFKKYEQVILSDWVRGANPPIAANVPFLINLFLCAANSEIIGRVIANALYYAITVKLVDLGSTLISGHSAGAFSIHFTSLWFKKRYGLLPFEYAALESPIDPAAFSTKPLADITDAELSCTVHTTCVFPVPLFAHLLAVDLRVGTPFPSSGTDLYINGLNCFISQTPPCDTYPFCSHFWSIIVFTAAQRGCKFSGCHNPVQPPTGVLSSDYGTRGSLCIYVDPYPLSNCSC